jgi:hypothetical protein
MRFDLYWNIISSNTFMQKLYTRWPLVKPTYFYFLQKQVLSISLQGSTRLPQISCVLFRCHSLPTVALKLYKKVKNTHRWSNHHIVIMRWIIMAVIYVSAQQQLIYNWLHAHKKSNCRFLSAKHKRYPWIYSILVNSCYLQDIRALSRSVLCISRWKPKSIFH